MITIRQKFPHKNTRGKKNVNQGLMRISCISMQSVRRFTARLRRTIFVHTSWTENVHPAASPSTSAQLTATRSADRPVTRRMYRALLLSAPSTARERRRRLHLRSAMLPTPLDVFRPVLKR